MKKIVLCESGEIGKRIGLKIQRYFISCGFKSHLSHHNKKNEFGGMMQSGSNQGS